MSRIMLALALFTALVATLLQIVSVRHEARQLFVESQNLNTEAIELGREWGQLLLEQGTLVTHRRIEELARERLNMETPERKNVLMVGSR